MWCKLIRINFIQILKIFFAYLYKSSFFFKPKLYILLNLFILTLFNFVFYSFSLSQKYIKLKIKWKTKWKKVWSIYIEIKIKLKNKIINLNSK